MRCTTVLTQQCFSLIRFNSLEGLNAFFGYIDMYSLERKVLNISCMVPQNTHITSVLTIIKTDGSHKIMIINHNKLCRHHNHCSSSCDRHMILPISTQFSTSCMHLSDIYTQCNAIIPCVFWTSTLTLLKKLSFSTDYLTAISELL
jgi:hypothetical protein